MKTITQGKATLSPDGKTLTVVFDVADQPFNSLLTTRVSHGYSNPLHTKHPRRIQSSNAAVFCEAPGVKAAILNEALIDIFNGFAPDTSFVPQLKKVDSGAINVISELPVIFQWESSADGKTWANIAGANSAKLDTAAIPAGTWKRLVIANAKGKTISTPTQITHPQPAK